MTNEITNDLEPLRKWAKAAARGETDKIPYIDITNLINEVGELRAKVESLAADAERWKKFERALRTGHIPGAAHGRRFKIIETCPMYGDEKEFTDFIGAINAMAKERV